MKKLLITVIGAAAALGASAGTISTQQFEEETVGTTKTIEQLNAGGTYWSGDELTNTYEIVAVSSTPSAYSLENPPTKGLGIKTTFGNPLTLNAKTDGSGTTIPASGLYFDSVVKFTVCDAGQNADMYNGAKIVMWLEQTEDESKTNLIVRAGYLSKDNGQIVSTPTNYVCTLTGGIDVDKWHRVTIKAIGDITTTGDNVPGFAIYIDQMGTTPTTDINCSEAKWNNTFDAELVEAASLLNVSGALFPTLDLTTGARQSLASVSFDGTGALTDTCFTDDGPAFAKDIVAPKAAVKINNVDQEGIITLADAIDAANGAATDAAVVITLAKGFDFDAPVTIKPTNTGVSVVLDFNGFVIENTGSECLITNSAALTVTDSSSGATGGIVGKAICQGDGSLTINGGNFWTLGAFDLSGATTVSIAGGSFKDDETAFETEETESQTWIATGKTLQYNSETGLYDVVDYVPPAPLPTVAENPWYESPGAIVLAQNLPGQTDNIVSAFHGQGEGEYLGLTYSTNPQQFDLFTVDGTNAPTTVITLSSGDASLNMPGFRGVAISKTLGVAMTMAYYAASNMYVFPLTGGAATVVSKPSAYSFDAGAFSPDGKYFFSNALNGESSNQFYVKWAVSDGGATLTKVGSISAGGRGRSMAYAKINGRDLVFGLVDTGKVAVIDMTGDDASAWSATDMITGLPAHSYGTLCVSGVNVVDDQGDPATPHLTVATSANNGATKVDVLNVYALTVPAIGAVTASLTKSFDEDALTAAGFGDISDANRYGNTVYVTDDEATIYFARPDNKLYAGQFAYVVKFVVDGVTNSVPVFPGATVAQADPTKENYIFDGWFLPGAGQAFDLNTPVTQDLTLTAKFTAAEAKIGTALYRTLKAAVDAAQAGDTVTVLADCTVAEPITFTTGITVSNDCTVTLTAAYALRFANGNTPVTFCGTGSYEQPSGVAGSPILVGNNEVKASYGMASTFTGSLVLESGDVTILHAKNNVIKVENGTFVMNGGSIAGGKCGVKADSENGDATTVVTINGGTVNNATAAFATVVAGTGSATITVNGGEITGPFSKGAGTTLTIPGASTAKFDRNQSAFCADGYETTQSGDWFVVTAVPPSVTPIVPDQGGSATYVDDDAATAAAAAINANKETLISVDSSVTGEAKTTYLSKVQAVANGNTVTIQFTTAAAEDAQTQADADNASLPLANIAAADVSADATITATPGFYYTVKSGTEPGNLTAGTPVLATGNTVKLSIPNKGAAGFYKIEVKPTK